MYTAKVNVSLDPSSYNSTMSNQKFIEEAVQNLDKVIYNDPFIK